ncbi:carbohydrate ABC transporter permease [Pseudobutyrivibrio sp.]|jgi:raffinose/stachyose/melibiose transport system permease protein|uniref:carbohydrate ABC transporter permease n=1 Tax=Pseudobutyrivibrio sp. TaxID=2014367 RepID=UPI001D2AAC89|nr:sugar ABC transporter permease [Pseudobutyrivibrio sp.]MBE5910137.1 sugar ABC transporter permease [Pseudobutyrivibrio sp.]
MDNKRIYPIWFLAPAMVIFTVFFLIPIAMSLIFSMMNWTFTGMSWAGFNNYITFFNDYSMTIGIKNTIIYAFATMAAKCVLGFLLAVFLTSNIKSKHFLRSIAFFPNIVSTIAVGITFTALMHPSKGLINKALAVFGITGPDWLGNINIALGSVIATDVWKGVGVATVIYIAGITSIDKSYYEAASIDGATSFQQLIKITVPLCRPSVNSVIILALTSGMRCFDLIWSMTGGGPGFATDVMASVVYKKYAAGYYGLSTAGNVIMFILIAVIAFPLQKFLQSREAE